VRYFWNSGAVVQVWLNGIVWAGSMAMRMQTIREVGLCHAWSHALSVDATINRRLRKHGYRVRFVPGVMVLNTETIALRPFLGWVQRQLIAARSSGGGWLMVTLHTLALVVIQSGLLGLAAAGLLAGDSAAACVSVGGLAFFWGASLMTAAGLELSVRRVVRSGGGACRWIGPAAVARAFPAIVLTYLLYPCAFMRALSRRVVAWRGVEYEIEGPGQIRMVSYQPVRTEVAFRSNASVV
jgi:hypothetical protein